MILTFSTLPPSTNNLYINSSRGRFLSPKAREAKDTIGWEARSQYRGKPLTGPLIVTVDLYWPNQRNHDIDNIKLLLDSLTGIAWEDDGQIVDLHLTKAVDKTQPRVEMTVRNHLGAKTETDASAVHP